jgi:hypothetical protein
MTTIAVRAGTMASDSCIAEDNGTIITRQSKLTRTPHDLIIGGAGDCSDRDWLNMLSKVRKSSLLPSLMDFANARQPKSIISLLILFPNREVWSLEGPEDGPTQMFRITAPFVAIGAGSAAAIGAMKMGASARRAVEIACEVDINSRAPVFTMSLAPIKRAN